MIYPKAVKKSAMERYVMMVLEPVLLNSFHLVTQYHINSL